MTEKGSNPLELSDEAFLEQNAPPSDPDETATSDVVNTDVKTDIDTDTGTGTDTNKDVDTKSDASGVADVDDTKSKTEKADTEKDTVDTGTGGSPGAKDTPGDKADDVKADDLKDEKKDEKKEDAPALVDPAAEKKEDPEAPNPVGSEGKVTLPDQAGLESFYSRIMTPFKANGRMVELKTPEEAIQLMQMGANYTRKMQELQPHRKALLMLETNKLLNEDKLSFLIDLDKKDPEAIKKLIKDAGIDPLDIDVSTESNYLGGNHTVSDEEAGFRTVISDLSADPAGKETLVEVNQWDDASKEVLWKSPEIMTVIHEQREQGIYATIKAEVDRQITLGKIPPNMPFLQAYKSIGDQMAEDALKNADSSTAKSETTDTTNSAKPERQEVDTRVAAPKKTVDNDDAASAASPTRSTHSSAKGAPANPLAMSDDVFLKQMENRL